MSQDVGIKNGCTELNKREAKIRAKEWKGEEQWWGKPMKERGAFKYREKNNIK